MTRKFELWEFISSRLNNSEDVVLLVVGESSGSSPGRAGYKMAVASDGQLCGSVGGGVMEVNLVEQSRAILSEPGAVATGFRSSSMIQQIHRKNVSNASGMICSGKQTVIFRLLKPENIKAVDTIIEALEEQLSPWLTITATEFLVGATGRGRVRAALEADPSFEKLSDVDFTYTENLGHRNQLYIVGGGHCALALSELMSKLDFRISIFDDRPELNTIEKNRFADEITIIDSYDEIGELIPSGSSIYVVVMTLGYRSDATVIRALFDRDFTYFGVLGSKAKMKTLMKDLKDEGLSTERLSRVRTPIGLAINSRTPEEIAVSIAAEIISVKNGKAEPPA
jgi:xanthine dehydrogenase accessory factor